MIRGDYPRTGGGTCFYDACRAAGLDYPIDGSRLHPDCLRFLESKGYVVLQGEQQVEIESDSSAFLFFAGKESGGHVEFLKSLEGVEDELKSVENYFLFAIAYKESVTK